MTSSAPSATKTTKIDAGDWLGSKRTEAQEESSLGPEGLDHPLILVVDDEAGMRNSVRELLKAYGYQSLVAANAEQALEILSDQPIGLMLLDINMPGMSGIELLQVVKCHYPKVSAIIVSGESTFDNATVALRGGACDFLRKPYLPDDLILAVQNTLEKRRLNHEMEHMRLQLEVSEQRHRFIVNNSPDIIYMLDDDGRFVFINERITSLLGYTQDEVIGRHFSEFVHADDLDRARFAFNERRTGQRASRNIEFRMLHKDGNRDSVPMESRSIPIELNAMGIYLQPDGSEETHFAGTYGVARDISERKRSEALINYQLHHDLLTGLPNRGLFQDRLAQTISHARRNKSMFALLYLDMDRFKMVNDSYGHLVGDELLQAVAGIMRSQVRDSDTLARISGDEFTLLLPDISRAEDAAQIARNLLERFKTPVVIDQREIPVTFSIGIAIYPEHGDNSEELVHHADLAMYHVKSRGKRDFALYDSSMHKARAAHPAWENDIRKAIINEQFEVMLQPQQDTQTGELVGAEALLRWRHPDRGMVMPNDFIAFAEETGLIIEIGEWVLRESCRLLRNELRSLLGTSFILSVNISARQLMQDDFVPLVKQTLAEYGIPGSQIELEITEHVLMQSMEHAAYKLRELSNLGVRIAVDDFGVGYSSLSYLRALPLHTLKIDRSFISAIRSVHEKHSIVSGLILMARELELEVVAEGVETGVQLEFLKLAACPRVQGFLLGAPMPPGELLGRYPA